MDNWETEFTEEVKQDVFPAMLPNQQNNHNNKQDLDKKKGKTNIDL
jgi:hypothetical protein